MKDIYVVPQYQTILDHKRGDCFRACIATITGIPLRHVPNFCDQEVIENATDGYWWVWFTNWLGNLGCDALFLEPQYVVNHFGAGCVFVVGGKSPRFPDGMHAVVMSITEDKTWKLEHDPHPDGTGIVGEPLDCTVIVPRCTRDIFSTDAPTSYTVFNNQLEAAYQKSLPASLSNPTTTDK